MIKLSKEIQRTIINHTAQEASEIIAEMLNPKMDFEKILTQCQLLELNDIVKLHDELEEIYREKFFLIMIQK